VKVAPDPAAEPGGVAAEPIDLDPMEVERLKSRNAGFLFGDLGGGPV
jgi:hypothetical protein